MIELWTVVKPLGYSACPSLRSEKKKKSKIRYNHIITKTHYTYINIIQVGMISLVWQMLAFLRKGTHERTHMVGLLTFSSTIKSSSEQSVFCVATVKLFFLSKTGFEAQFQDIFQLYHRYYHCPHKSNRIIYYFVHVNSHKIKPFGDHNKWSIFPIYLHPIS